MTNEVAIKLLNQEKIPMILDGKPNEHLAVAHIKAIEALEENTKLKAENERLKELMPKICETCEYEDEIGYEEPCDSCNNRRNWKLKSEE